MSSPPASERVPGNAWFRLAVALRRPRPIAGLDDRTTLRWVLPLAASIWVAGIGAFVAVLVRDDLFALWRLSLYASLGPFLLLGIIVGRRAGILPGFLPLAAIVWIAGLSVTTPFYYDAGGFIGTAVTAGLATWLGRRYGALYASITVAGQLLGGWFYDDPFVVDRTAALALSMTFAVWILGGIVERAEDVADERDLLLERFSYLSHHDVLTGLGNRRALEMAVTERIEKRIDALTLVMLDIDSFKQINDRHGHHEGDLVLQAMADRLTSALDGAFVGRLGGDEFVVLFDHETDDDGAVRRVLDAFESPVVLRDGRRRSIGVSAGAAAWSPAIGSLSALLSAADHRLYGMKRSGRSVTEPSVR